MSGVVHGGLQEAELDALRIDRADVFDLSANLNPLGPHPDVLRTLADADPRRYPEPDAASLRDALAEHAQLDPSQVIVTAGATAAIHLIARALLAAGEACRIFTPAFGEYAAAALAAEAEVIEQPVEFDAVPRFAEDARERLVVLCNPNNPTGAYVDRASVEALVEHQQSVGGTLMLDVAYDPFVVGAWDADALVRAGEPVAVVHSMTKLHALPGVRLGYVTAPEPLISRLAALQPAWAVGAHAAAAGPAMVRADAAQRRAAAEVAGVRAELTRSLRAAGLTVADSSVNFMLVQVGDAAAFRLRLLRRGFAVRDCTSFGLAQWVRVAVPVEAAARRLVPAFVAAATEGSTQ